MNAASNSAAPKPATSFELEALNPQLWSLGNGISLHAVREGRGTPLIFIHGAMGDWRSWAAQWPVFVPKFDCVSFSRRFSFPNKNHLPSPDHSALDDADDLLRLLDALRIERTIVVGSSYGGFTALALAVRAPQRVLAVVAVEPPMMKYALLTPKDAAIAAQFRAQVIEPANAAFRAGDDVRASLIMTGGIQGAAAPAVQDEAMKRRLQNMEAMKRLALSSDEFPLLEARALQSLPMPVMLMSGQNTAPVHAAIFRNLVTAMPAARIERIANAGHSVTRDQADLFNALTLDFLTPFAAGSSARG